MTKKTKDLLEDILDKLSDLPKTIIQIPAKKKYSDDQQYHHTVVAINAEDAQNIIRRALGYEVRLS